MFGTGTCYTSTIHSLFVRYMFQYLAMIISLFRGDRIVLNAHDGKREEGKKSW